MFEVNEDMILYAFRYSLGRMTYSVGTVSDYLIENWHRFSNQFKENIINEITIALNKKEAGEKMDEEIWRGILLLESAVSSGEWNER